MRSPARSEKRPYIKEFRRIPDMYWNEVFFFDTVDQGFNNLPGRRFLFMHTCRWERRKYETTVRSESAVGFGIWEKPHFLPMRREQPPTSISFLKHPKILSFFPVNSAHGLSQAVLWKIVPWGDWSTSSSHCERSPQVISLLSILILTAPEFAKSFDGFNTSLLY